MKQLIKKLLNKTFDYDNRKAAAKAMPYAENIMLTMRQITPLALKNQIAIQSGLHLSDKAMQYLIDGMANSIASKYKLPITINACLITVGGVRLVIF